MGFEKEDSLPESSAAIVAITRSGVSLALQLQSKLPGSDCYVPARHSFAVAMGATGYERLGALFPNIWPKYRSLICIMATGIVVRLIAPLLQHKTRDPAVVVLDERGSHVISLVSGHLGGANRLAERVAGIVGGQAVITTASDVNERPALDLIAAEMGLEVENVEMLSRLTRAILEDEAFWIFDPQDRLSSYLTGCPNVLRLTSEQVPSLVERLRCDRKDLSSFLQLLVHKDVGELTGETHYDGGTLPIQELIDGESQGEHPKRDSEEWIPGVWVSETLAPPGLRCLMLRPRNLVVGVGCNRGTPVEEVLALLETVFLREGLSPLSIRNLASVDLKADEPAVLEAARSLDRPVRFYTRHDIEHITVPNPSSVVAGHIGVKSVCEATALLSAGTETLLVHKQKTSNVTLAVARVDFSS